MKIIEGNVVSPKGFKAAGNFIGLKKVKKDLALILSDVPAVAAGCFTKNIVKAAPVLWDMYVLKNDIRGIVVNSGNANACTGEQGLKDAAQMAEAYAAQFNEDAASVLVCSTGVIGVNLPMEKIKNGIKDTYEKLGAAKDDGDLAAESIMTTDTFPKTAAVQLEIGGKTVTIGAMAKGSGMIHPDMATLLSFITTDAAIEKRLLQKALKEIVAETYNMISVDRDTSTNDTVLVLANGLAGNTPIDKEDENYNTFKEALKVVNKTLAIDMARDGEGASKLMEVTVSGAKTKADAVKASKSVVSSNLVKAALFGEDANWGRIICAAGYSGAEFSPSSVSIKIRSEKGEISLMGTGKPIVFDEDKASAILSEREIFIDILMAEGEFSATAWGCDLTYDYVKINGDYRS